MSRQEALSAAGHIWRSTGGDTEAMERALQDYGYCVVPIMRNEGAAERAYELLYAAAVRQP